MAVVFSINVVRADDLLVLRLDLVNLALDPDESQRPRRLIRDDPSGDALVIAHFPPQHISELCGTQVASGAVTGLPGPGADRLESAISGESRLVFRLPNAVRELPLTLGALLDWDRLEPVLPLDENTAAVTLPAPREPTARETAIELPLRLLLSPDAQARWTHRRLPFVNDGRGELWTTALTPPPPLPGQPRGVARTRAVWSPDLATAGAIPNPFRMPLSPVDRAEITRLSSDFRILAPDQFSTPPSHPPEYTPHALQTRHLRLSALGGWLSVQSQFDFPTLGPLLQLLPGHAADPGSELFALQEWRHVAAMGRDQDVRTARRGYLYPFGHRGNLVTISERRFTEAAGSTDDRPAYLVQHSVIVPHEPGRRYDERDFPFVEVTIAAAGTPRLDPHPEDGAFIPHVDGQPFLFALTAIDRDGRTVHFAAPMVFVPANAMSSLSNVRSQYRALAPAEFFNQQVSFAAGGAPAIGNQPGPSTARADTIRFDHSDVPGQVPPFLPKMDVAMVRLPAAELLLGGDRKSEARGIRYHPDFVKGRDTRGVFASFVTELPLAFPADRAGGIAAPVLSATGLSLKHGAVPNGGNLAAGAFNRALDGLGGELLGVIKLKDIVAAVGDVKDLPTLRTEATPQHLRITFEWTPKLVASAPAAEVLLLTPASSMHLKGLVVQPLDGSLPTSDMNGRLARFGLSFLDVLQVDFDELSFQMVTGQKPSFGVAIGEFTFRGDLTFLNPLMAQLKTIGAGLGLASGPAIAVTPQGIAATLTLALPNVPLGVFNLQNVAVSAGVSLFFSGRPAELSFALSKKESPFLLSYSVFGGGGFFRLTVRTGHLEAGDSRLALEASLQFGAVVALDLVLAKGVAQVMAVIEFAMAHEKVILAGALRIHGCLEVLGLVSISVDVELKIAYDFDAEVARASGKLLVQVRVLAFSESVELTVERSFSTKKDPSPQPRFRDTLSDDDWDEYCRAFA